MFKQSAIIAICTFLILMITVQEVSCGKLLVAKQKRMYIGKQRIQYEKRDDTVPLGITLTGSPAAKAAAANGLTSIPSIDTGKVQLPPLPDTSSLFTSVSSVSGLTQQIPNLGGNPQSATGKVYQQYVPPATAPAPVPEGPPVTQAPPAAEKDKDDDNDDDDDDDDDDEDDD